MRFLCDKAAIFLYLEKNVAKESEIVIFNMAFHVKVQDKLWVGLVYDISLRVSF